MRLAFFSPHYGTLGGVQLIVDVLSRAALGAGHDVTAIVDARADAAPAAAMEIGLYPFPLRARELRRVRRFGHRFPATAVRLVRAIRACAPDVVSIHCSRQFAPYVAFLRGATRIPQVLNLQEGAAPPGTPENRRLFRMLVRAADAVAACSAESARYAAEVGGAERVLIVSNGYDPSEFGPGPVHIHSRPYILGVGRLEEQKGFDVLIRAFARLGRDDIDLLLAGDGSRRATLTSLAATEGVADRVHLMGATDRPTTVSLYRGASVVACPSRFEGLPLVCVEALALGCTVVASAVNGIPEVIRHEETGLLVPADDVGALATALRRALDAPDTMRGLGARGRAFVEHAYSWDVIARAYLGLCAEVASGTLRHAGVGG